jgi:hypothetical protein
MVACVLADHLLRYRAQCGQNWGGHQVLTKGEK